MYIGADEGKFIEFTIMFPSPLVPLPEGEGDGVSGFYFLIV
jgi:hypothetical protein